MSEKTVLMAVGSSGGHIFPAFALSEQLEALFCKKLPKDSSLKIHFVHSDSQIGKQLLSESSYPVHSISVGGLAAGQGFFKKLKTLFQLPSAFFQSIFLIRKIKADLIFGTGGSVTFPVLTAGFIMRKKIAIWEGNTSLGLANKVLTPFVSHVFTVFPKVKKLSQKKQIWSAYPLRKQVQMARQSGNARPPMSSKLYPSRKSLSSNEDILQKRHDSNKNKFKVLVLGGSQGSLLLNQAVSQSLEETAWRKDIFIYHQTGDRSFKELNQKYESLEGVFAFAFSKEIQNYYQDCDLLISRAGSGSVAEIACFKKAVILVPLTYSAGGHQLQNASWLSSKNCVQMIKEKDFNTAVFKNKILELKEDSNRRKQLAQNLKNIYHEEDKITPWLLGQLK